MRRAYLYLHLSIFLWGFTGIFGKAITLNEGLLVWYRMGLTSLIWLAIGLFGGTVQRLNPKATGQLAGIGLVLMMHWLFFYASIKYSNISIAMSCLALIAVFSSVLEPLILRRPLEWIQVVMALIGLTGMLFIFRFTEFARTGIALGMLSSLLGSLFTIFNKQMVANYNSETITTYELTSGFLFLTLLMPVYLKLNGTEWVVPSVSDSVLLVLFVVVCTVIPFNLSMKALRHVSAFMSNLSLNMEPVYGIVLAFIIYREHRQLDAGFYGGMGLILLSVVLYSVIQWRAARKAGIVAP
ncbi:MAG: DMT family transporter [Chitinophagales bacterium]|nr:DMT family transporter [Chitinophagales bacterium]